MRNDRTGHILAYNHNSKGYRGVCISVDGKKKTFLVHRLVAKAFIPNVENKREVNHIDGNKENNNVSNLEWATSIENNRHRCRVLGYGYRPSNEIIQKNLLDNVEKNKRRVMCVETSIVYSCCAEAGRAVNRTDGAIRQCAKGITTTCGGYHWRYV